MHQNLSQSYQEGVNTSSAVDCRKNTGTHPLMFRTPFDGTTIESSFNSVGLNTGNQVFTDSIRKIFATDVVSWSDYVWHPERIPSATRIITTDMIWITENGDFSYMLNQLSKLRDEILVPMSVGIQASHIGFDFKLNDSAKKVLEIIQERAVIGVRGEYVASILEKNGIKNIQVIGCPSLYYWNDPDFQVKKKDIEKIKRVLCNFRTFYGRLSVKEKHFLSYCADRKYTFVEQTNHPFTPELTCDNKYYNYVSKWLEEKTELHFNTDSWLDMMSGFEFSMGGRFHGNVISLWKDIPSLFITVDSRTQELIDHFKLPYITMQEFDKSKPIEYYYELADYSEFNKAYRKNFLNFKDFLQKNKIELV